MASITINRNAEVEALYEKIETAFDSMMRTSLVTMQHPNAKEITFFFEEETLKKLVDRVASGAPVMKAFLWVVELNALINMVPASAIILTEEEKSLNREEAVLAQLEKENENRKAWAHLATGETKIEEILEAQRAKVAALRGEKEETSESGATIHNNLDGQKGFYVLLNEGNLVPSCGRILAACETRTEAEAFIASYLHETEAMGIEVDSKNLAFDAGEWDTSKQQYLEVLTRKEVEEAGLSYNE